MRLTSLWFSLALGTLTACPGPTPPPTRRPKLGQVAQLPSVDAAAPGGAAVNTVVDALVGAGLDTTALEALRANAPQAVVLVAAQLDATPVDAHLNRTLWSQVLAATNHPDAVAVLTRSVEQPLPPRLIQDDAASAYETALWGTLASVHALGQLAARGNVDALVALGTLMRTHAALDVRVACAMQFLDASANATTARAEVAAALPPELAFLADAQPAPAFHATSDFNIPRVRP